MKTEQVTTENVYTVQQQKPAIPEKKLADADSVDPQELDLPPLTVSVPITLCCAVFSRFKMPPCSQTIFDEKGFSPEEQHAK